MMKKMVAFLLFIALLLTVLVLPGASDTPISNSVELHSWEELKMLCDATKRNNKKFLEQVSYLEEEYCTTGGAHLALHLYETAQWDVDLKDAFSEMYDQIAERRILVPQESSDLQLEQIRMESYTFDVQRYSISYQTRYDYETYGMGTSCAGNYSDEEEALQGELVTSIDGEGYTATVWLKNVHGYQTYHAYMTVDGDDYPSFHATISVYEKTLPEGLLPLFGQFRITTAEEILNEMEPDRTWIWVTVAALVGVAIAVGAVLVTRRKREGVQEEPHSVITEE